MTTDSDSIVLHLAGQQPLKAELRRKNTLVDAVDKVNKLKSEQDGDEQVLTVKLADYAEYRLDVYESRDSGGVQHKQTYFITRVEQLPEDQQKQGHGQGQDEKSLYGIQQEQEIKELSKEEKEKQEKDKAEGNYYNIVSLVTLAVICICFILSVTQN